MKILHVEDLKVDDGFCSMLFMDISIWKGTLPQEIPEVLLLWFVSLLEKVHAIYKTKKYSTVGCLLCNFKAEDKSRYGKSSLQRHYMIIHKRIKQTCNACDLGFSNKFSLTLHKTRKHEPVVKNFKCNYCDYKLTRRFGDGR